MIFIIISTFIALAVFHELYWKRRNLPPGPTPIPLLGNLLSLNNPPPGYEAFARWRKQYGDVFTFWMGNSPTVMICGMETMKETFIKDSENYIDKKQNPFMEMFRGGEYGIVDTNGAIWKNHKKFALSSLKDFGLGRNLMQEKILLEIEDIFKVFDKTGGTEINIHDTFERAVANVINQIVFGYRFDETREEEYLKLKEIIDAPLKLFSNFVAFLKAMIPSISNLPLGDNFEGNVKKFRDDSFAFFNTQIENHRKDIDFEIAENSDFVEAFLKEQRRKEKEGDFETFSTKQLANVCLDLWFAGLGTTTNTIAWSIAYLLNTPGVQERLHEELNRVIGSDRLITTADKNDLPYMNAFINESQRCTNIVPLNPPHVLSRDTVINGYSIAKGTAVIAQISSVMYDEKVFPIPDTFNPDRFMENGKLKKIEEFVPFSVGKRNCIGEGLARMELFLFVANFFNRYKVAPSKEGPPKLVKNSGNVIAPVVFNGVVVKRN